MSLLFSYAFANSCETLGGQGHPRSNAGSTSSAGFHSLLPVLYFHDPVYGLTENDWLKQTGGSQSHTFPTIISICYFTVMGNST